MEVAEYETMARAEEDYWWYLGLRRMMRRTIRSLLGEKRQPRMLDAGCGTGGGLAMLSGMFPGSFVVGTDMVPSAIQYSARRNVGHVVCGSVNSLPFTDATFDLVLSGDVLCVDSVDDGLALTEAYRVLRPGGFLITNVPAFESLRGAHDVAVNIRHRYRRDEFERLLNDHGFTAKKLIYWNAFLFPIVFAVRRLRSGRGPGASPTSDLILLPGVLNRLLTQILTVDTWACTAVGMPFGTSVFSVAVKPVEVDP